MPKDSIREETGKRPEPERLDPERPTPALLRLAYEQGIFPMADPRSGAMEWFAPDPRGIIPLDAFRLPRSARRILRDGRFAVTTDLAFEPVIRACAQRRPGQPREATWIDERLIEACVGLHREGAAHSVEAWHAGRLVGGLYGVHLGGAFFGESMFCRPELGGDGASKACLAALVGLLRARGFRLLDTQFETAHLEQFGGVGIRRSTYLRRLARALEAPVSWPEPGPVVEPLAGLRR